MSDKVVYRDLLQSSGWFSGRWEVPDGGHYEYESLGGHASDTFRLLLLEPGSRKDPLMGGLFVTRQSDGVDYAALSYFWGNQKSQTAIILDGKMFKIGVNLASFLIQHRHPEEYRVLWADSICINQADLSERGHQVRLMGNIYGNATTVFAWLGSETLITGDIDWRDVVQFRSTNVDEPPKRAAEAEDGPRFRCLRERAKRVLEFMSNPRDSEDKMEDLTSRSDYTSNFITQHRVNSIHEKTAHRKPAKHLWSGKNGIEDFVVEKSFRKELNEKKEFLEKMKANETNNPVETSQLAVNCITRADSRLGMAMFLLGDLCRGQYWTRTWIVQELLLAQSVVVCVGDIRINWEDLSAIIEFGATQLADFTAWNIPVEMNRLQNFVERMEMPVSERRTTLGTLLHQYKTQDCLDKRDRIYAFLALANDCDMIIPDYTQSSLDLFFHLKDMIKDHALLRMTLDLPQDEIRYRAETLKLPYRESRGEVYLYPAYRSERTCEYNPETLFKVTRVMTNDPHRIWAKLPEGYTSWAKARKHFILDPACKDDILQLRPHEMWFWVARTKYGDTFKVTDDNDVEILNIDYTGVQGDKAEAAQFRRYAQKRLEERAILLASTYLRHPR